MKKKGGVKVSSLGGTATDSLGLMPDNLGESGSSYISVAAGNINRVNVYFIETGINSISATGFAVSVLV